MLKILTTATTIIMLGLAATGVAQARGGHFGGHHGSGIIRGYQPQSTAAVSSAAIQQSGSTNEHPADR